jgi:Fur family transcriptional regulator, ferric uptake regulator
MEADMQKTDNKELFTSQGLKNTKSRNLVYNILEGSDLPITAEQVFLKLKENESSINLSTVYRVLEVFVSKEIALKSSMTESSTALFELNRREHKHHLVCVSCRKMFSIDGCPFEELEKHLHENMDFDVTGHRLEIYGYCRNCKTPKSK